MKIKQLLKDPEKWTKNLSARDKLRNGVDPASKKAVCWCLYGAIFKCYPETRRDKPLSLILTALGIVTLTGITLWNDDRNRTHKDVLKLVTKLDI